MGSLWQQVVVILATLMVIATVSAVLGLLILHRSLRRLQIPSGAVRRMAPLRNAGLSLRTPRFLRGEAIS